MSEELATGIDYYTLIAWVQFSETGTELDIMEPCYEEPFMSSTKPWTQSASVWATKENESLTKWSMTRLLNNNIVSICICLPNDVTEMY